MAYRNAACVALRLFVNRLHLMLQTRRSKVLSAQIQARPIAIFRTVSDWLHRGPRCLSVLEEVYDILLRTSTFTSSGFEMDLGKDDEI